MQYEIFMMLQHFLNLLKKGMTMSTNRISLTTWLLSGILVSAAPFGMASESAVTPDQMVSAFEGSFGVTKGERRNHTKGTCAAGEFIGHPDMAAYSSSALFSSRAVPVVARFSLAGGNPKAPDSTKNARGMALEFRLPKGDLHYMTMLNTPMFGAAQAQTLHNFLIARKADPATGKPDPEKMKAFKDGHPDNHLQSAFLASNNPPTNYANSAYFGIHTFKFVNSKNKTTLVRFRFVPQDGEKRLSDDELKSMPPNFLEQRLIERAKQGPVRWDMMVTIGVAGDPEDNPTLAWPDGRKEIKAGTLTMTSAVTQKGAECEKINFNPLVMAAGIEPTNDPILQFRSPSYAIGAAKRLSEM